MASGATTAFTLRAQGALVLTARVREGELAAFRAAVSHGVRFPGALYLSVNGLAGPFVAVRLLTPSHGDEWEPARDAQYKSLFDAPIVAVRSDGLHWNLDYYGL